jgi:hypothetical protein
MSDTPPAPQPAPTPPAPALPQAEPLWSPQLIIALYGLTIVAGTILGVFLYKDLSPLQGGIAGSAIGTGFGGIVGFYFGSSKSSQNKDTTLASIAQAAPTHTP